MTPHDKRFVDYDSVAGAVEFYVNLRQKLAFQATETTDSMLYRALLKQIEQCEYHLQHILLIKDCSELIDQSEEHTFEEHD